MTRVVNLRAEPFTVYIGRGSEWGNRYSHQPGTKAEVIVSSRDEAIDRYRTDLWAQIRADRDGMIARLAELFGQTLGCYCKPLPCHGDVLVKAAAWANEQALLAELERCAR